MSAGEETDQWCWGPPYSGESKPCGCGDGDGMTVRCAKHFIELQSEVTAEGLLRDALAALEARGKEYDPERGRERSMPEIVRLFKEATGIELTETQGWRFMACVKRARLQRSPGHRDSMVDLVAYEALGIESEAKKGGQP